MAIDQKFALQTDATRNLASLRYFGQVTAADAKAAAVEVERALRQLRPGFTVLTDLSGLDSMDLDCVPSLTKIMDLCRANGVATVVRIVPDPAKDIGFNILSIIHLRRGVRIVTCATLEEAGRIL